ncbi:hypothetical protein B0O99DRAFT_614788 [Bisporella sp. PMI_857]|nr:hypothetical protein B0O99DRAFT_614788 [Bisporella sp. PMI_857]
MTDGDLCDEDPLQNEYQQEYDDSRVAQKLTGGYPTTPKIDNDSELTYSNTPAADGSQAIVDCDMELERDMEEMFTNQTLDAQDNATVGDVEDGYSPLANTQEADVNDLDLGRFMEGNFGKPISEPQNQDTISIVTSGPPPMPPSPAPEDQGAVDAIRDRDKRASSIDALFDEDNDSKLHSQVGNDISDGEMDFETEFAAGFIRDKGQWRSLRRLFIEDSDEPAPGSIESLFSTC